MNSDLSDYWLHFVSEYGRNSVHIAPRFFDIAPDRWEELSAIYYARHGFKQPPKEDVYIGKLPNGREAMRSHRVDAIALENPAMDDTAKFLHQSWMLRKAKLAKNRAAEPDTVILPPPPEPPKPKPVELPKEEPKPEPKKPRAEWRVKLGVYLSLGTPVILLLSSLLGPPWNTVAKFIWELLKTINGG